VSGTVLEPPNGVAGVSGTTLGKTHSIAD